MTKPKTQTSLGQRRRRQRILNNVILVVTLVVIIAVSIYALGRPTGVTLPPYLNRCLSLTKPLAYNSTFDLNILVDGVNQTIPASIGIAGTCIRPISTFTSSGAVHVNADQNITYTLKDFFLVWGNSYGPTWATFNSQQLFSYRADNTHQIVLRVGNNSDSSFENFPLPRNGSSLSNPRIVISYG
ncbi:MAG: hypothetical protein AUJ07_10480 [Crenarchaeota archaeon 13_1_40CM_3_53_5]|nr:MAG: hypothetical protein AUJ07_10480 [Crenarchaeota archaeon 13_1_40CM_3_53_5]